VPVAERPVGGSGTLVVAPVTAVVISCLDGALTVPTAAPLL